MAVVIDDDVTYDEEIKKTVADTMTTEPFSGLPISDPTKTFLKDMGFPHHMTHIQATSIPPLLQGKDVLATSSTCFCSGQALAFLIPAVELLYQTRLAPSNGTHIIVVCPTRISAESTHSLANCLLKYHPLFTLGLLNGGLNRVTNGVNMLVSTPSQLLDHLTKGFSFEDLKYLVIYESGKTMSEAKFKEVREIIRILPSARQTSFFSSVRNDKAENIARLLFTTSTSQRVYIDVRVANGGPEQHGYCVVPRAERLVLLYSFLARTLRKRKVMVVFSSCHSVQFHAKLLRHLHVDCVDIHGLQNRQTRDSRVSDFSKVSQGILLCTEMEAHNFRCEGINADWVVQYDPPDMGEVYVSRVERMRGGKAVIFLSPEELGFVGYLKKKGIREYEIDGARIADVGPQLKALVSDNGDLRKAARGAFRSFVLAYNSNCTKEVFNVHMLDLRAVEASFCLTN